MSTSRGPLIPLSVDASRALDRDYNPAANHTIKFLDTAGNIAHRVDPVSSYYTANAAVINGAFKALGTIAVEDLASKTANDILGVAQKVMGALDCVQQIHPFVGVVVLAFKGIITLEMKRRENDKRVAGLVAQMSDMMTEFLQLNELEPDPDVTVPSGNTVRGRLQTVLEKVMHAIVDCGNAIDKYYKSRVLSKFFKAMSWETKFTAFAGAMATLKKDIKNALAIRTALHVEDIASTVSRLDVKLDSVLRLFNTQTPIERSLAFEVQQRGGEDAVLSDTAALTELLEVSGDMKSAASTVDKKTSKLAAVMREIRTPLEAQLEHNKVVFEQLLSMQTNELKEAITASEHRIIQAFEAGAAYKRVHDPHVRQVWKIMKWSLSVQTLYFVSAVHDYFVDRYAHSKAQSSYNTQSPLSSVPPTSMTAEFATTDSETLPPINPDDEWCLKYLAVRYVAALKEAFDSDSNGIVSVREVNNFMASAHVPKEWSILRRLAFSAAGWHAEMLSWQVTIRQSLNAMHKMCADVLPVNRSVVAQFLNSFEIEWCQYLVGGLEPSTVSDSDISGLAADNYQRDRVTEKLTAIKYEIESEDYIAVVFGKESIEQYILVVICCLLWRYGAVVTQAKSIVLDRRELSTQAMTSLYNAVDRRTQQLSESFRQQGLDPEVKFRYFAQGLYQHVWSRTVYQDFNAEFPDSADTDGEDFEFPGDPLLRYSPLDPAVVAYGNASDPAPDTHSFGGTVTHPDMSPLDRFRAIALSLIRVRRVVSSWEYIAARSGHMRAYAKLGRGAVLDSLSVNDAEDGVVYPKYLDAAQQQELLILGQVLTARDLGYCRERADLDLRQSTIVHYGYSCDGCGRSPMIGIRYDCIDCDFRFGDGLYQLCSDCVGQRDLANHSPTHLISHNMVQVRREIPQRLAIHNCSTARKNLRFYLAPPPAPPVRRNPAIPIQAQAIVNGSVQLVNGLAAPPPPPPPRVPNQNLNPAQTVATSNGTGAIVSRPLPQPVANGNGALVRANGVGPAGPVVKRPVYEIRCSECGVFLNAGLYCCITCSENDSSVRSYFCAGCWRKPTLVRATMHDPTTHFLALVRHRYPTGRLGGPVPQKGPTVEMLAQQVGQLQAQMRKMEDGMEKMTQMVQSLALGMQIVMTP
ncbi:hypothetical protein EXIGLDRAFT_832559 [Exidia glandulosa HHB12029]|uniref:ZZ-type domain-containing protein n=1 Tax=Exidia glandulosa HHB12029 TaxID=1314781 RepID=A0A165LKA5_EXIGL|nr:hypothetical protein EXIGLDRAFT_832559 [Exidia glandulosa HHB12029]